MNKMFKYRTVDNYDFQIFENKKMFTKYRVSKNYSRFHMSNFYGYYPFSENDDVGDIGISKEGSNASPLGHMIDGYCFYVGKADD